MLDRHLKLLQFFIKIHQSTLVLMKLLNMSMFQTAQFAMIFMLSIAILWMISSLVLNLKDIN